MSAAVPGSVQKGSDLPRGPAGDHDMRNRCEVPLDAGLSTVKGIIIQGVDHIVSGPTLHKFKRVKGENKGRQACLASPTLKDFIRLLLQ